MASSAEPTSASDRFVRALQRSGLFARPELHALLGGVPDELRTDAARFADHLVRQQHLTRFQAYKLLQGIWQGLVLGPYHVLAPIGRGGMGAVYLARSAERGTRGAEANLPRVPRSALRALKVLPPKRARADAKLLARFLREMDLCRVVEHPHITRTFDAGEHRGVYYIAMEYVRGRSLRQAVVIDGPLPVARAARLFAQVAAALAAAHDQGLIHRDLKPSNVMVTPNGHAKVLDFGLALMEGEDNLDQTVVGGRGYVVGTMDFISPEQVEDPTQVDGRSDLYSLGCSLYYALTGRPPFPGGKSSEKMRRHRTEFATPITDLNPTVPVEFAQVVERLMKKSPARRYPDAAAVREALLPWAADEPELPLDVAPDESDAETVAALERIHSANGAWDSAPVLAMLDTSPGGEGSSTMLASGTGTEPVLELELAEEPEEPRKKRRKSKLPGISPVVWWVVGGLGLLLLVFLLERMRGW